MIDFTQVRQEDEKAGCDLMFLLLLFPLLLKGYGSFKISIFYVYTETLFYLRWASDLRRHHMFSVVHHHLP